MQAPGKSHLKDQRPLVSICIPTFNGEKWIQQSLASALAQQYEPLEILVIDDASTDRTVEVVRSTQDARLRVIVNDRRVGLPCNWNECIRFAEGEFIKFLFQDDLLYDGCVEAMMSQFFGTENLGLVFSPRDVLIENAHDDLVRNWGWYLEEQREWIKDFDRVNHGREIFVRWRNNNFRPNVIGEPSNVMVKKSCFDRVGFFNPTLHQNCDIEMWLRLIFFFDVGFVQRPLSLFRVHSKSTSVANCSSHRNWLENARLINALLLFDEIKWACPSLKTLRRREQIFLLRFLVPRSFRSRIRSFIRNKRRFTISALDDQLPVSAGSHQQIHGDAGLI